MRTVLILVLGVFSNLAFAAPGDIRCVAEQFEIMPNELKNHVKKELVKTKEGVFTFYTAEIGEYAYTMNPNMPHGEYSLTVSWGPDWTSGMSTTGTFGAGNRMVISLVDQTKVFKLACVKE